ncbi:MAG TPA: dTDP-4-dehydrorhamnose 3,5-epimerase [Bacteroidales bacterium]|nr:dTDP-4-dehydrorhamnose 3,5-epimerase [Bacteroidales bacterium]
MEIEVTSLPKLLLLKNNILQDNRGCFYKSFNREFFVKNGLDSDFKESYYSVSHKNVIRGMHFQTPPFEHTKLVYVSQGAILDVVLDLRESSPTYGKFASFELNANKGTSLYIPKGMAHGFCAKENNTIVNYLQTSVYSKDNDCGILFNSFNFDWPIIQPIVSERDLSFPSFQQFKTPFE